MKTIKRRYYYWRERGLTDVAAGRFLVAEKSFSRCLDLAKQTGSDYLRDISICNIAACRIERGITDDENVRELKSMFMRTRHAKVARLATYHLARMYEIQGDFKKAFFYARISLAKSRALGRADYIASSLNQAANLLVAESHFRQAAIHYEEALRLLADQVESTRYALIEDNLGYCRMMLDDVESGIELAQSSLDRLNRVGAGDAYRVYPEMDLCYGFLELDDFDRALKHGERAYSMVDNAKQPNLAKNLFLLLVDCSIGLGDMEAAQCYYGELSSYYPALTTVSDFLLAFHIRQVVNLRL